MTVSKEAPNVVSADVYVILGVCRPSSQHSECDG
jgi:hypothetical protein